MLLSVRFMEMEIVVHGRILSYAKLSVEIDI